MRHRKNTYDLQNDNSQENKVNKDKTSVYKGIFLSILAGALYSFQAVIVKRLKNLDPGQLALYRFFALIAFTLPQAVQCGDNLLGPKHLRNILIYYGLTGGIYIFLVFIGYSYLPLGESAAIINSDPVFVLVAARIFLKEPCGYFQSVTVFTTIIGIFFSTKIVLKIAGGNVVYTLISVYGFLSSIASVILNTMRFVLLRKLTTVHQSIIILYFAVFGIVETAILTALLGNFQLHKCGLQSLLIIILGLVSYGGQTMHTMAVQCELAGPVSTIIAASIMFLTFIWDILLFHNIPDLSSSIGAILIGLSVISVGLQKWVSSLDKESSCRKKLSWMLK